MTDVSGPVAWRVNSTTEAPRGVGWDVSPGGMIASGLTGYGASQLLAGGKSKAKKSLIGAAAGGLMGGLSGRNMISGGLSGMLAGGIGGLL